LTDTAIRNAKPADKPVRMFDGGGLYLEISPATREQHEETRNLLANGTDPGAVKRVQKSARREREANTLEAVASRWFEKWETGVTASTAKSQRERLVKHIMPSLGHFPVADIDAPKYDIVRATGRRARRQANLARFPCRCWESP
jgi:hypothetical protein